MLNVHVLYEHGADLRPYCTAHIRLLRPLAYPANSSAFRLSWGTEYKSADVILLDRLWKPGFSLQLAGELVERVKRDQSRLIYSVDDNLLDLKTEGPILKGPRAEELAIIRYFAREADGIIVSTDRLRERLTCFNKKIVVVPNALDERLFEERALGLDSTAGNGHITIGYMGTFTHDADLMMVLQALRATLRKHRDTIEMQFVGGIADPTVIKCFDGLAVRILDVGDHYEYPDFARWMARHVHWDIAIAPLEDNVFNRCKSDIKFLDYGILGLAGIYSDVPPYRETVRHLETGYLAANNVQTWSEAFERLVRDRPLREKLGQNAREYVLADRTLRQCAQNWPAAIMSIVNG